MHVNMNVVQEGVWATTTTCSGGLDATLSWVAYIRPRSPRGFLVAWTPRSGGLNATFFRVPLSGPGFLCGWFAVALASQHIIGIVAAQAVRKLFPGLRGGDMRREIAVWGSAFALPLLYYCCGGQRLQVGIVSAISFCVHPFFESCIRGQPTVQHRIIIPGYTNEIVQTPNRHVPQTL